MKAVWEIREKEVDWFIEKWRRSLVEYANVLARFEEADANNWNPDYQRELDLVDYHRWIAQRLICLSGRDAQSADRAVAEVRNIADRSWRYIARYGWGFPELDRLALEIVGRRVQMAGIPKAGDWWDRMFNA